MKKYLHKIALMASVATIAALALGADKAEAVVIANENFEGGATGWSDNTTTIGNAALGNVEFLGRFGGTGGAQTIFKTFALSGSQTQVTINFDFFEIDSWDGESFLVFVDDGLVINDPFSFGSNDNPASAVQLSGAPAPLGFLGFVDQTFRYTIVFATTGTSLKLGFGSTLDQSITDESFGIDNVLIRSNFAGGGGDPIPEPASLAIFSLGLLGLGLARRRRQKA